MTQRGVQESCGLGFGCNAANGQKHCDQGAASDLLGQAANNAITYGLGLMIGFMVNGALFDHLGARHLFVMSAGLALFDMGLISADYDGDGDTDVLIANDGQPNFLFQNDGMERFTEVGLLSGFAYDAGGRVHASMGVDVSVDRLRQNLTLRYFASLRALRFNRNCPVFL